MKRKLFRTSLTLILALVMTFHCIIPASAAPSRKPGTVKYLSEVALIEAKDQAEADALLAEMKKEENGGFEGMISLDLNAGGSTQMYLVYKSSTNVDDAITDLSVMNMNGDFTMGNYEQLFNKTLENYVGIANDYRTMALEFKKNYEAGEFGAKAAYRQMNYYYIETNGQRTYMGDYMLNFPSDASAFARVLFSGNLNIVTNLRALMAMGVGDPNATLADRITASYLAAKNDASVYSDATYAEAAKQLLEQVEEMKSQINNLPAELAQLEKDTEMDAEAKQDLKTLTQENLDTANAFYELLKEISMGDVTLGDYIMNTAVIEAKQLYPVVAAATQAEALMMEYNSFYSLLLYDVLEMGETAMDEILAEFETDYEPISVYYGVQNDLAEGTVGVTGNAGMASSTTGQSMVGEGGNDYTTLKSVGFSALGAGGVASVVGGSLYLGLKKAAISANYTSMKTALYTAMNRYTEVQNALIKASERAGVSWSGGANLPDFSGLTNVDKACMKKLNALAGKMTNATKELEKAQQGLASAPSSLSGGQIAAGSFTIVLGAVMMGISIWQLTKLYSKYEINYTEIPDNMVHVVNHKDLGDRFVNYKNVPSYYYEGNVMQKRENDLNAYDGRQWVSLYYTKNYEAGSCLTTTPDLIATEAQRSGYTGIHLFGYSSNYNLNAYCNRENAESVYLAFKYSTNKKSAETDVPNVVGTIVSYGGYAFACVAGVGLGMGLMALIKKKKTEPANKNDAAPAGEN